MNIEEAKKIVKEKANINFPEINKNEWYFEIVDYDDNTDTFYVKYVHTKGEEVYEAHLNWLEDSKFIMVQKYKRNLENLKIIRSKSEILEFNEYK